MCIIAIKPADTQFPKSKVFAQMWNSNPHGAGYMYAHNGHVHIRKGFMSLYDFWQSLYGLDPDTWHKSPFVFHFRIATHGGIKPSRCHPFPLSASLNDLEALSCTCDTGIAHNGIIPIAPHGGISDTMEYIRSVLAPNYSTASDIFTIEAYHDISLETKGNRLVFLAGTGQLLTTGQWFKPNEKGIPRTMLFSNGSYHARNVDRYMPRTPKKLDNIGKYANIILDR